MALAAGDTEIRVVGVSVNPNQCELDVPVDINLEIESDVALEVHARITLVLDVAVTRHAVTVGGLQTHSVSVGKSAITLHCPSVSLSDIPRRIVNNVAVLRVDLIDGSETQLTSIQLVLQVYEKDGVMHRTIFSPFS
jgi:hypothetical protein